jgi:hypothetical protein
MMKLGAVFNLLNSQVFSPVDKYLQVDYWDKSHMPVGDVIVDKLAYAGPWPSLQYALRPGSIVIEPITDRSCPIRI